MSNGTVSVLNREPMGMKHPRPARHPNPPQPVSVLNREPMGMKPYETPSGQCSVQVSVLNREPMGMKLRLASGRSPVMACFSAQPRADGDEANWQVVRRSPVQMFQCSTASRWG